MTSITVEGLSMDSSSSIWWTISAIAKITLLPSSIGRALPIHVGYRPNHKLADGLFCMGIFKAINGDEIKPGGTALAEITFLTVEPFNSFFKVGMIWDIHEGALKIGTGEITSIIDSKI